MQEFGKIEAKFKQFKVDICKTLEVEKKIASKLSNIAQKSVLLENWQVEHHEKTEKI